MYVLIIVNIFLMDWSVYQYIMFFFFFPDGFWLNICFVLYEYSYVRSFLITICIKCFSSFHVCLCLWIWSESLRQYIVGFFLNSFCQSLAFNVDNLIHSHFALCFCEFYIFYFVHLITVFFCVCFLVMYNLTPLLFPFLIHVLVIFLVVIPLGIKTNLLNLQESTFNFLYLWMYTVLWSCTNAALANTKLTFRGIKG